MVFGSRIRCSAFVRALFPKLATFFLVLMAVNTSVNCRLSALCIIGEAEAVTGIFKNFANLVISKKYSGSIPLYFGLKTNEVYFGKWYISFFINSIHL